MTFNLEIRPIKDCCLTIALTRKTCHRWDMDASSHSSELDPKYLLGQLNTARKEINNLRQQVKSLRYILEKDVDGIKHAIRSYVDGKPGTAQSSLLVTGAQPSTSSELDDTLKLKPIGVINTGFPSKRGTPRQPGICKTAPGKVTLFNSIFTNPEHALTGLQDFSHMWILFHFHRNDSTHVRAKVAPPRLNGVRTGVFSTRSPHRPCPIGLSLVKIVKIDNHVIYFEGVDMVDQTPVLDIKPYIPQYDNPLHIEKLISRPTDNGSSVSDAQNSMQERMRDAALEDSIANQRLNPIYVDLDFNNGETHDIIWDSCHAGNGQDASPVPNISRDEEIAMRLQAEEFEGSPNFDDYNSRHYFVSPDIAGDENSSAGNTYTVLNHPSNEAIRDETSLSLQSLEQSFGASLVLESRTTSHVVRHLEDPNLENIDSERGQDEGDSSDGQIPRNSRLLDGADGPSTVCGTDMDLIHRRALNSRPDNSPVRMGVREAPDGEEGLESQPLTPSQTISNIHSITAAPSNAIPEVSNSNTTADISRGISNFSRADSGSFEVRVPEWISRPRTMSLSVIFNERALSQLTEILNDKADEQKRAIESVLREDPRSVYLRQRWGNQFYTFLIHDLHISCRFDDNRGIVTVFQVRHAGRTCECGEPEWQCLGHSPLP